MKISLVVPAFNEERLLGKSLAEMKSALTAFDQLGWTTELIVCDNNSTDKTPEIARAAGATVVFEPINQIARARNCGAAAATGDWLIFVDADSHPSADLFADVAKAIQSGKYLAGGATIKFDIASPMACFMAGIWVAISRLFKLMAGSFIFCETAAFREIGGFNEELFAAEELDLSKCLKQLARRKNRRVVILTEHPLVTSARKLHLYTLREHLRVLALVIWSPRSLTRREACHLWYDGRR